MRHQIAAAIQEMDLNLLGKLYKVFEMQLKNKTIILFDITLNFYSCFWTCQRQFFSSRTSFVLCTKVLIIFWYFLDFLLIQIEDKSGLWNCGRQQWISTQKDRLCSVFSKLILYHLILFSITFSGSFLNNSNRTRSCWWMKTFKAFCHSHYLRCSKLAKINRFA